MNYLRASALIVATMLASFNVGCGGSSSPFTFVPVTGKVTYEDGSPIPGGGIRIYFHSAEPPKDGMHVRPGVGSLAADGSFKDITSYKFADGLSYGKYKVSLATDATKVPKDYTTPDKTPLIVEVTESGQVLEIKVPKP
jgi:hypothetical protein